MNVIVNKDWTLSFENESDETLNANDVMWHRLNVRFEDTIRPTNSEAVLVVFQDDEETPINSSEETLTFELNDGTWSMLIPPEIIKMAQTWYMQILVRRYTQDNTSYVQKGTEFISFTVTNGAFLPDGSPLTIPTVLGLFNAAKTKADEAAESASNAETSEENARVYAAESQESATNAATAASAAAESASNAETSEENARVYAAESQESATNAATAASAATTAAGRAENAASGVEEAATAASEALKHVKEAADAAERAETAVKEIIRERLETELKILFGNHGQPTFYTKDGHLYVRIIKGSVNPYRIEKGRLIMTIVKEVI